MLLAVGCHSISPTRREWPCSSFRGTVMFFKTPCSGISQIFTWATNMGTNDKLCINVKTILKCIKNFCLKSVTDLKVGSGIWYHMRKSDPFYSIKGEHAPVWICGVSVCTLYVHTYCGVLWTRCYAEVIKGIPFDVKYIASVTRNPWMMRVNLASLRRHTDNFTPIFV